MRAAAAWCVLYALMPGASATPAAPATCDCALAPKRKPRAAVCGDAARATCELRIGLGFLAAHHWADAVAHCSTAVTLDPASRPAVACIRNADLGQQMEWEDRILRRLTLARSLLEKSPEAAQKELESARSWMHATVKGPLSAQLQDRLQSLAADIQRCKFGDWPLNLPSWIASWLPSVLNTVFRILSFVLLLWLAYLLLNLVRLLRGWLYWQSLRFPVTWQVSSVTDESKQSAAGVLVDCLNVRFNVLFNDLYTSSFLAVPPALGLAADPPEEDEGGDLPVYRNFLIEGCDCDDVRPYLSYRMEALDRSKFDRHRFRQIDAFEEINLKLQFVEASLGALMRNLREWWDRGRPSVIGSVGFEEFEDARFANVRLVAHYGDDKHAFLRQSIQPPVEPPQGGAFGFQELFSREQTFSVFASTRVDDSADAVYLASQRAAFRLLYRLTVSPDEPGLAIAVSSYRQGLRLLNLLV